MPDTTKYTAKTGDTFCSIAVKHGFANCDKLRAEKKNKIAFEPKKWVLRQGDTVHIPKTMSGLKRKATGKQWDFGRPGEPPVSVRFVHGQSDDKTCAMHPALNELCVSNYKTDKAGADRTEDFPAATVYKYDQHADEDEDAFKVEVHDAQTIKDELTDQVSIEALQPTYKNEKKAGVSGAPEEDKWEQYHTTERAEGRELTNIKAKRMPEGSTAPTPHGDQKKAAKAKAKNEVRWVQDVDLKQLMVKKDREPLAKKLAKLANTRFWTPYLRLVVDDKDWTPHRTQTLRIEPALVGLEDPADTEEKKEKNRKKKEAYHKIEILDHKVRAVYEVAECKATPKKWKCKAVCEAEVGKGKKRIKIAVHILRKTLDRGSDGEVSIKAVDEFILQYVRQFYAQANLSFAFARDTRLVQLPGNMFAISDGEGKTADGSEKIKVKVTVGGTSKNVEIAAGKITSGDNPIKTAQKLKKAIEVAFAGETLTVTATENPCLPGKAIGSADVLVGDPMKQEIELEVSGDPDNGTPNHVVTVGRIGASANIQDFDTEEAVGKIGERVLLKNYDTGDDCIDCIIVHELKGAYGEGFTACGSLPANERPLASVIHSIMVRQEVVDAAKCKILPHEFGHVLMDGPHTTDTTEIMCSGTPYDQPINGKKRLADPAKLANYISYGVGKDWNSTQKVRTTFGTLLGNW